jgi:hypothetical protein
MTGRKGVATICALLASLLAAGHASADMISPSHESVPVELVLLGLDDFPEHRFFLFSAISRSVQAPRELDPARALVELRDGHPTQGEASWGDPAAVYALGREEVVTGEARAWFLRRQPPMSDLLIGRLRQDVHQREHAAAVRWRYRVRQVLARNVLLEPLGESIVDRQGNERVLRAAVPVDLSVRGIDALGGSRVFLAPNPFEFVEPTTPPPLRLSEGKWFSPAPGGPLSLVAIDGGDEVPSPPFDAFFRARNPAVGSQIIHAWSRALVPPGLGVVSAHQTMKIERSKGRLSVRSETLLIDASGEMFVDHGHGDSTPLRRAPSGRDILLGGTAAALMIAAGLLLDRRAR